METRTSRFGLEDWYHDNINEFYIDVIDKTGFEYDKHDDNDDTNVENSDAFVNFSFASVVTFFSVNFN